MAAKPYRARRPLERFIVGIVVDIYRRKESPQVDQIIGLALGDPRFNIQVMQVQSEAQRVLKGGIDRPVRNVLRGLRFTEGPYAGQRACLVVPVPGRRAGFIQFTPRVSVHDLEVIRDRHAASARGFLLARDVADDMIRDVRRHGANTLEEVYGQMAIGL